MTKDCLRHGEEDLQAEGYEVETFTDSQLALEAIRFQAFDLVITDLKMENVERYGYLERVNPLHPHTE